MHEKMLAHALEASASGRYSYGTEPEQEIQKLQAKTGHTTTRGATDDNNKDLLRTQTIYPHQVMRRWETAGNKMTQMTQGEAKQDTRHVEHETGKVKQEVKRRET